MSGTENGDQAGYRLRPEHPVLHHYLARRPWGATWASSVTHLQRGTPRFGRAEHPSGSTAGWTLVSDRWVGSRGHLAIESLPQEPLLHVALLKQELGADFSLVAPCLPPGRLYARGERFRVPAASPARFQVEVRVQSTSFGSFEQWVVFDFGRRPALLRKLVLQLGQAQGPGLRGEPARGRPEELQRWHGGSRHVVPGVERTAEQVALLAKYKAPDLALDFSPGGLAPGPISCTNYRQRMHQFLYEEEAVRQELVAK